MNKVVIGQLIKDLRRAENVEMGAFAKEVGLSEPTLARIESGNHEVSIELLDKVCQFFNTSLSDFFRVAEERRESTNTKREIEEILN